jgi:DNA-binding response OmpR family regulator
MEKILIVEDEKDMVLGLKFNLEARNFNIITAYDGAEGYNKAVYENPDLVLLDIMLPKKNGYEVCRDIKKVKPGLPVIMLTARSQESEIVAGLDLGADDYITKPFSVLELTARINAVLRRSKHIDEPGSFEHGKLKINFKNYTAVKSKRKLELTPREYEILKYFVKRQGEIVRREDLLNDVWGYNSFPNTRTVDAHIVKLRQKIEDSPDDPRIIITIHGVGYKLII